MHKSPRILLTCLRSSTSAQSNIESHHLRQPHQMAPAAPQAWTPAQPSFPEQAYGPSCPLFPGSGHGNDW
uniref:Uncharacterized protein n=1 Tax=Setaria italica TaxID=4555 RepID=K3ZBI4_SETIT